MEDVDGQVVAEQPELTSGTVVAKVNGNGTNGHGVNGHHRHELNLQDHSSGVRVLNAKSMIGSDRQGEISPAELAEFCRSQKDQLGVLERALKSMQAKRVVLEAAHIYGYESPGVDHYYQMRVAAMLSQTLASRGLEVVNLLFVDDLHSNGVVSFDIKTYLREAALRGWAVDEVYFESSMREPAEVMVATLEKAGKVLKKDKNTVLNKKGIHLIHLNRRGDLEPSCAALDAAFTKLKLSRHDAQATINVLPEGNGYKQQQRNTRAILREAFGEKALPFLNFFVNMERNGSPKHKAGRPHQHG